MKRNEEQFTSPTEVYGVCLGFILGALSGQGLAAGAQLVGLWRVIIIITRGHYTPDREGSHEDYEQSNRVDDLQVGEKTLSARIGDPGQRGRGWAN